MHYVIGDIHANIQELHKLLTHLELSRSDTIIFVGDYIDCLPHTSKTLQLLEKLSTQYTCIFLKGNHEFLWEEYLKNNDTSRQDYLVKYGGLDALKEYGTTAQDALRNNAIETLKPIMQPYLDLIAQSKDFFIFDKYIVLHAGLLPEQYENDPLLFKEQNYFIRPKDMDLSKKYLDKYILVAGHSHFGEEPLFEAGYINIDLGGRQEKYIGALALETEVVIRSDGMKFTRS